jgi:hypothetical protein
MSKTKVVRKPRGKKSAAKPAEKPDLRVLDLECQNAAEYIQGAREAVCDVVAALQGDRDDDERILEALAELAGCIDAANLNAGGARRELDKLLGRTTETAVQS